MKKIKTISCLGFVVAAALPMAISMKTKDNTKVKVKKVTPYAKIYHQLIMTICQSRSN